MHSAINRGCICVSSRTDISFHDMEKLEKTQSIPDLETCVNDFYPSLS